MSDLILKTLETRELKLNTMQLRGFYGKKMRRGSGGGSSGDGFPVLPGDVTRWHFGGLTNEMMAAMGDPRIEDADGKGRFLSFKNFAWKEGSGVGGYQTDYNVWEFDSSKFTVKTTDHSFKITSISNTEVSIYRSYFFSASIPSYTIRVTGLTDGQTITYQLHTSEDEVMIDSDGIYVLPAFERQGYTIVRFYFGKIQESCNITIEQLPLYPGFILGDGVDDFAVTEKELNFEDTYTVYTAFIPFQDDPARTMSLCGKDRLKDFYMYYSSLDSIGFFSVDKSVSVLLSNGFNLIVCKKASDKMLIKNLITGKVAEVSVDDLIYNPGLYYLWRSATIANYSKTAIAGQIIDNGHFTTDEEDEKVLNWHKKQYPWLFPDQAWTVTGKTNEDADRATIANITGNGNNLVLSNLGFIEGSGYNEEGEYAGYLVTDGVDDKIQSSNFPMGKDFTVVGEWKLLSVSNYNYAGIVKSNNLYVYNSSTGINIYVCSSSAGNKMEGLKSLKAICSDGRVYDDNWVEYKLKNVGDNIGANSTLDIGTNKNNFTKIAFKNLEIYNNKILSKEDCIKAYNYLQTLKAK